jgi:hypothetical protein
MEKAVKKAGPRSAGSALKFEPVKDAQEVPGAAKKARTNGPHGSQIHADGSTQASPNRHKPTDGGKGGLKGL